MNKTQLIKAMSEKAEIPKSQAEAALNAFMETVTEQLKAGKDVLLMGFGTFQIKSRRERPGHNPRTGEAMVIPIALVPKFNPGKFLKAEVNGVNSF